VQWEVWDLSGKMTVGCIVQARMGSTRLPGKSLKKIGGKPVLGYVIERLRQCRSLDEVVVATSTNEEDNKIEEFCRLQEVNCFKGSEEDVLARYFNCASLYKFDTIVRITGDCPLLSPKVVDRAVGVFRQGGCDYVSNTFKRGFPRGLDVEVFSFETLKKAFEKGGSPEEREHVTLYIYRNPDKFRLKYFTDKSLKRPELKLCIDTENDFRVVEAVFLHFGNPLVGIKDAIRFLDENPELKKLSLAEEGIYREKTKRLKHKFFY
jgi:spore coat polysaccharide biosynthesis protein SpsF